LRGAALALFLLVAIATARQARGRTAAWLGVLLSLGGAAYVVCSWPEPWPGHDGLPSAWFAPVLALCTGNIVVFWLFTRAVFDDGFRLAPWHGALWLAFVAGPLAWLAGAEFITRPPIPLILRLAPAVLALLALV